MPSRLWRLVFTKIGNRILRQKAAANQLSKQELLAQPYAKVESAIELRGR